MKVIIIEFEAGDDLPVKQKALVHVTEAADLHKIFFNVPGFVFSGKQWNDLQEQITRVLETEKTELAPAVNNAGNLPAMNMRQAVGFVFKGGGGFKGLMERMEKIKEMAKAEMSEKERKAADGLMKNLKDLM
jgi:hypothetical protein